MKSRELKSGTKNLKKGNFKKDELELYGLSNNEVAVVLEYQTKLPILQEENVEYGIDGVKLHEELGVKTKYQDWIKNRIEKYELVDGQDFKLVSKILETNNPKNPKAKMNLHILNIDTAKELAMVENNNIGRLARKYFIAIEKAFKNRIEWNFDIDDSVTFHKSLKKALVRCNKQLISHDTFPSWAHNNVHVAESCLLNEVIIGMSSKEYKELNGLGKNESIRNTFTEEQLEYYVELQKYDADLIMIQDIYDYIKRKEILIKKYKSM